MALNVSNGANQPMPEDSIYERMNRWVVNAMVSCEVANFEWEWRQAEALCDRYGCMEYASGPFCPRCGR